MADEKKITLVLVVTQHKTKCLHCKHATIFQPLQLVPPHHKSLGGTLIFAHSAALRGRHQRRIKISKGDVSLDAQIGNTSYRLKVDDEEGEDGD